MDVTSRPSSSSRSRAARSRCRPTATCRLRRSSVAATERCSSRTRSRPGLGRTGKWFALEHWGLEPDFVLVGKALSGGYMPVAAMVTTREIFQRAVGTLERSYVHQSTYGRNRLSMAAGLATMRVIDRDGLVERATRVGELLREGLAELQRRHELVKEIRASGLMIGVELGAPSSRAAKLSWRAIHMASEGLFPQLVVIPLHRDHRVITMAAGKNDTIKLLPPLTLSEQEAGRFLDALDAVLADCESGSKNWAVVRDIADRDPAPPRRARHERRGGSRRRGARRHTRRARERQHALSRQADRSGARGRVPRHRRKRLHRRAPRAAAAGRGSSRALPGAREQRHLPARAPRRRDRHGRPDERTLTREGGAGLQLRLPLRRARLGLGDHAGDHAHERRGHARAAGGLRQGLGEAVHPLQHHRRLWPSGRRRDRGGPPAATIQQLVRADEARRRGRGPPRAGRALAADRDPASRDRVRPRLARSRRRDRPRDPRAQHAARGPRSCGRGALLCRQPDRRRGARPTSRGRPRPGVQRQRRPTGDLARVHRLPRRGPRLRPRTLEHALLARQRRRLLARAGLPPAAPGHRPERPPLLSRQAVQVLGCNQDFSNRKARETLGWEPRIDYAEGLRATLAWLREAYPEHARAARG